MKTMIPALACLALLAAGQAQATGPGAAVVRMQPAPDELPDASMLAVNDCATQIVAKELDLARAACDRAVRMAKRARPFSFRALSLAAALSNHSILELMSGDLAAAQSDISRAMKLAPERDFVARNQLAIEYALAVGRIARQ